MPSDDLDERGLPARIASWTYGIALGLLFGWPFGVMLGADGPLLIGVVILSMFAVGYTMKRIMTVVPEGMANAFVSMIWPSGSSTPYSPTYSYEQALAAKGDVNAALTRYRMAMRLNPTDPAPRLQVAELLYRSDTPEKAATFFAEARRLSPEHELYVTQRLIDLYIGPVKSDVKALVELRRLMDRFPGTREAESARRLFDRIKAEQKVS